MTAPGSHVGVLIFQARERHSCVAAAEACNSRHDVNDADVGRALLRGPELLDPRAQERGELLLDIRHVLLTPVMPACLSQTAVR